MTYLNDYLFILDTYFHFRKPWNHVWIEYKPEYTWYETNTCGYIKKHTPHLHVYGLRHFCNFLKSYKTFKCFGWFQLSYASSSPDLSDRDRFPRLFRMYPAPSTFYDVTLAVLKHYGWTKVATLHQEVDMFSIVSVKTVWRD